MTSHRPKRTEMLRHLTARLRRLESARPTSAASAAAVIPTGLEPLDRLLGGGFARGTLVEWLAAAEGAGTSTLALSLAAGCLEGSWVVLDPAGEFYPPAAAALGVDLAETIIVRSAGMELPDMLWALEQSLRCPAVSVVFAPLGDIDGRVYRRLQLAVETGGGVGLFVRPAKFAQEPSWARLRLLVEAHGLQPVGLARASILDSRFSSSGRRLRVTLVRGRASAGDELPGKSSARRAYAGAEAIELELCDETPGVVRVASPLADPETPGRAAGA
ncbi:MAG: hypothetical protein KY476_02425 [Planctomycetes bacterium]|nr:hypothetical protein [Planctomycetota bacterium]